MRSLIWLFSVIIIIYINFKFLPAEVHLRSQVSPCAVRGGHSDIGKGSHSSTSVFPCQHNFIDDPHPT